MKEGKENSHLLVYLSFLETDFFPIPIFPLFIQQTYKTTNAYLYFLLWKCEDFSKLNALRNKLFCIPCQNKMKETEKVCVGGGGGGVLLFFCVC